MNDVNWGNGITMLGVRRPQASLHINSPVRSSTTAAILLGTLGGCGGGLLRSACNFNKRAWHFTVPRHLSDPHFFPARMSFAMAVLFYALTDPHSFIMPALERIGGSSEHTAGIFKPVDVHAAKWIVMTLCIACNSGTIIVQQLLAAIRGSSSTAASTSKANDRDAATGITKDAAETAGAALDVQNQAGAAGAPADDAATDSSGSDADTSSAILQKRKTNGGGAKSNGSSTNGKIKH